ncbi:MAG: redoxin domain-containing protein [Candidatus Obscuribacterales bacterium]|nr:redoxin domain-containing protein [Candidatus Obscuribacterales bacterium]
MKRKFWIRTTSALLLSLLSYSASGALKSAHAAESTGSQATLGKTAPAFTLNDSNGQKRSLQDANGKIVVLEWINFDCPFVKKQYNGGNMQKLQKTYTGKGVVWYSICSSAEGRQGNYPAAKINELLKQNNAGPTAYLFDPDGAVGRSYGARSTPHMFVINQKGTLVYAGAIDDNPSADISDKPGTNYVQKALDETLANKAVSTASSPAYGCSVKYAK